MQDGLYKVTFRVGTDYGCGVVTLSEGKVAGGDGGFFYVGALNVQGTVITGQVDIRQHTAGAENVFAGLTNFRLTFNGQVGSDTSARLQGATASAMGQTVWIDLELLQAL
ncbi:GrlR family regulatory protein [Sphingomonas crocodyli]|uniref:Negative regulator GrlR n=1 Tax=Sphingomonas crocodyli TaxID=1979270 RepID=A0A437M787_9SPHN|nr:GrlR family regulatory protein [Sphingomonas crocodyli]RVT93416.1 hypothetical protein EOD43_05945 [Sphingomonas crocodyli]